jgi:hypothetical protein
VGVHLRSADRAVEGQCEYLRRWAGYCIGKRQPWVSRVDDLGNRDERRYRLWIDAGFGLRLNPNFGLWLDIWFRFWFEPDFGYWNVVAYDSYDTATAAVILI